MAAFWGYSFIQVALVHDHVKLVEPSSFEEAWQDALTEEYGSILKMTLFFMFYEDLWTST